MQSKRLLEQLQTIKNNFALAQMGIVLMNQPDAEEQFTDAIANLAKHPETPSFSYITNIFRSEESFKHAIGQFQTSTQRNCLKEAFELVKAYGKATNQTATIEAAPWYQFLRIVRNCLSHDFIVSFNTRDLKRLPVTWSGLTFQQSMNNAPLQKQGFLSRQKASELLAEIITYVEQNII